MGVNEFIVAEGWEPSPDLACRVLFGKSIEELAEEILKNEGGKYDRLYKKKA